MVRCYAKLHNCRAKGFRDTENVTLTYAGAHDRVELGVQFSPEIVDSCPQRIDEIVNLFVDTEHMPASRNVTETF